MSIVATMLGARDATRNIVRLVPDSSGHEADVTGSGHEAEKRYLLCLLNVAEELLALMPPLVQRKYGLIKGTLAIQLGSTVDVETDSAIIASLTSGIQPQISSLSESPLYASPHLDTIETWNCLGMGQRQQAIPAVVRRLDQQLAPMRSAGEAGALHVHDMLTILHPGCPFPA
jgi:hypothetical protein